MSKEDERSLNDVVNDTMDEMKGLGFTKREVTTYWDDDEQVVVLVFSKEFDRVKKRSIGMFV